MIFGDQFESTPDWKEVNYANNNGDRLIVNSYYAYDTTGAAGGDGFFFLRLPISPANGDFIEFLDSSGNTSNAERLYIYRSIDSPVTTIMGDMSSMFVSTPNRHFRLTYFASFDQWRLT